VGVTNKIQQLLFDGLLSEARRVADEQAPEPKPEPPHEAKPEGAKVIQLPIWAEAQRATPNALLRSALFAAGRRRRQVKRAELAAWGDTKILYTGETLNQADEDVWLQLVHLYRQQSEPADLKVRFSAKPFLRELGAKRVGGSNIDRLTSSLARLRSSIHIRHGRSEYVGGLVDDFALDEPSGRFVARFNPKLLELFGTGHTRLDWETRKALPTGLATWLHRWALSHKATEKHPHRETVAALHGRSGSGGDLKDFRRKLKKAMTRLEEAGVVEHWTITRNDALEYTRLERR
jgi:hypothetical protein